ncbi:MAG: flavodoxin-dependent (E)-4-hydroxy-3-methylbut-2-enyl-diphosphate synthase [Clostridia bacterium]
MRKLTKQVKISNVVIGGNNPIAIQSMSNIPSDNFDGIVKQAIELENLGCDIFRIAVPNLEAIRVIDLLKKNVKMPIVADIHFDYKIAIEAANAGFDKIRINPGNIGDESRVKAVVDICKSKNIPIRIGVNGGSLEKHILEKYKMPTAKALFSSAKYHIDLLEKFDFNNIVISVKSSSVKTMIESYTMLSNSYDYPLHLGVTEAGTFRTGIIKSAIGIGGLLLSGIGDTIRVSLTDNPTNEILAAKDILKATDNYKSGPNLISCPTCGRTKIDLISISNQVEKRLLAIDKNITVAVMGCVVNGPGEAREADIGIAGGDKEALLFKKGKIIRKINEENIIDELFKEIEKM